MFCNGEARLEFLLDAMESLVRVALDQFDGLRAQMDDVSIARKGAVGDKVDEAGPVTCRKGLIPAQAFFDARIRDPF
jgi:hypothetical protein